MEAREQVLLLLDQYKCPLIRKGKHDIYRLPTGKPYVLPSSPSDYRSWKNNLADLKVELGLSTRGQEARVGEFVEKRTKPRDVIRHHDWVSPAATVPSFNFGEKVRAALTGKTLEREVVENHLVVKNVEVKNVEVPVKRRYNTVARRPSPGPVKQWTKEEIDAANSALKAGHYTEYIRRYDESNQPMQKPKQEAEVLTVEQIRYTIGELEREVVEANKAADKEKKESDLLLAQSEELMRQSSLALDKQKAILDKANSFQDVINSLEIIISDLERVRPMMGLLNRETREASIEKERISTPTKKRRAWGATQEVIFYLIKRSSTPMAPAEIYRELKQIEGYENFARHGIYNFLSKHSKPGDLLVRVSEGRYTFKKEVTEQVNNVLEKFTEEPDRKTG